MKKFAAILSSALFLATSVSALVGCGGKENSDDKTVMNISLNPSVEFVLDKDNKVETKGWITYLCRECDKKVQPNENDDDDVLEETQDEEDAI